MKNPLQHLTTRTESESECESNSVPGPAREDAVDPGLDERPVEADRSGDVEVRRNGVLAAALGSVAAVVSVAYLVRAIGSGSALDWLVFVVIGVVAIAHGAAVVDSRAPLLVADRTGIRLRLGRTWQGLPWEQIEEIEHAPRRALRDGRLVAFPVDSDAVLAGLGSTARRQAAISERVHGAPFAVPLGMTTRVVGGGGGLTAALLALAPDPELVVEVVPEADQTEDLTKHPTEDPAREPSAASVLDHPESSAVPGADAVAVTGTDLDDTAERQVPVLALPFDPAAPETDREDTVLRPVVATSTPSPLRLSVAAMRTEVTRRITGHHRDDETQPVAGSAVLLSHSADLSTSGPDDTGAWRSATVVLSEIAGPVVDPVIGPQLARARQALGLDVGRLAERTRIRTHVIDAIEVDDFEPCGGDFYARGHLRTLARVLGVDAAPLLTTYDETYAAAPIDPRRVFEAELATGSDGAIRSLRSGANWSVVVAAVMALVLAWSVARLVTDRPDGTPSAPSLRGDSAGLTSGETLAPPVPVVLTAEGGGAKVVVRDGAGAVVFKGNLAFGQSKTVKASPPVRVQTSDGSLTVAVNGQQAESMGRTGAAARNTFVPRVG